VAECRIDAVRGGRHVTAHGDDPAPYIRALRAVGYAVSVTPTPSIPEVRESSRAADQVDDVAEPEF